MPMFSTYDEWKLATPPEYEWLDKPECHQCGEPVPQEDDLCDDCFAEWESQEVSFEEALEIAASPQMPGRAGT